MAELPHAIRHLLENILQRCTHLVPEPDAVTAAAGTKDR